MSEENSTITMLKAQPPILDQDNNIVSVIYVENNAVFNNYRGRPVFGPDLLPIRQSR